MDEFIWITAHQSVLSDVREKSSKGEGKSDVSEIDENEGSKTLQAECIKDVAAIERVAPKKISYQTMEWPTLCI